MAGFTPWSFTFITHHAVIEIKSGLNSKTPRVLHVLLFIQSVRIMFLVANLFYVLCVFKCILLFNQIPSRNIQMAVYHLERGIETEQNS